MKQEELPKEIYLPKAGVSIHNSQVWYRELPNGVRYIRHDCIIPAMSALLQAQVDEGKVTKDDAVKAIREAVSTLNHRLLVLEFNEEYQILKGKL